MQPFQIDHTKWLAVSCNNQIKLSAHINRLAKSMKNNCYNGRLGGNNRFYFLKLCVSHTTTFHSNYVPNLTPSQLILCMIYQCSAFTLLFNWTRPSVLPFLLKIIQLNRFSPPIFQNSHLTKMLLLNQCQQIEPG